MLAAAFAARFTLAEARRKRASYLQVAAHEMNLANVEIEQRRASAQSIASGFDLVTARAFGTSVELYEIAAAALRPAGILLMYASADQVLDGGSTDALAEGFESSGEAAFAERDGMDLSFAAWRACRGAHGGVLAQISRQTLPISEMPLNQ